MNGGSGMLYSSDLYECRKILYASSVGTERVTKLLSYMTNVTKYDAAIVTRRMLYHFICNWVAKLLS